MSGYGPRSCTVQTKHGYPVPDPKCTPGAFNPTVTLEILRDRNYRTSCAAGKSDLNKAQRCIAADWPLFLEKARGVCTDKGCDVRSEPRLDLDGCGG